MLLRDLDFYGIVPEEGSVKSASEGWASKVDERCAKIKDHGDKMKQLQLENDIEFLANYCASEYISYAYRSLMNGGLTIQIYKPKDGANNNKEMMLWNAVKQVYNNKGNTEELSKALMKFGLSLKGEIGYNNYCSQYTIGVKTTEI